MATVLTKDTKFTFSLLPSKPNEGRWVNVEIGVENERISYLEREKMVAEELEEWLFVLSRLLAGGYGREYSIVFEEAGFAVDLYPCANGTKNQSREERRRKDCVMSAQLLMRSKDKTRFLGGVYSLLLHRKEITVFVEQLRREYEKNCVHLIPATGEYAFAGVSPLGYKGCNYWYLDEKKQLKAGNYAWVRMGRRNREQIVYVDCVRRFDSENAPYNPATVKKILRKATDKEVRRIEKSED